MVAALPYALVCRIGALRATGGEGRSRPEPCPPAQSARLNARNRGVLSSAKIGSADADLRVPMPRLPQTAIHFLPQLRCGRGIAGLPGLRRPADDAAE